MNPACRCGHTGDGPHPCHGKGHTCGKPSTRRFYNPHPPGKFASLAGATLKFEMADTFACDECWAAFQDANKVTICKTAEWTPCDGRCPDCPKKIIEAKP